MTGRDFPNFNKHENRHVMPSLLQGFSFVGCVVLFIFSRGCTHQRLEAYFSGFSIFGEPMTVHARLAIPMCILSQVPLSWWFGSGFEPLVLVEGKWGTNHQTANSPPLRKVEAIASTERVDSGSGPWNVSLGSYIR